MKQSRTSILPALAITAVCAVVAGFTSGTEGVWGSYTWQFNGSLLQPGANTVTITNLDPSDITNYPLFIMVDYVVLSW